MSIARAWVTLLLATWAGSAAAATPWEDYLELPSSANATRVDAISYTPAATVERAPYRPYDLDILSAQVVAGDAEALRLVLRVRSPDAVAAYEELMEIAGRAIRSHPEMFLAEMERARLDDRSLEEILAMSGLIYTDRLRAQRYELEMRRGALASLDAADLRSVRDRCIEILDAAIASRGRRKGDSR